MDVFQLALCHPLVFLGNFPLWNLEFSEKFFWIGFGSGKEMPPEGAERGRLSESHICTRVRKIFFNLISHITHMSYRIYVRMHLHQIRRQLVTIWSRNFHLRVRFAEKYAKSNRILQKRTAYHGQKWQTVLH